MRKFAFMGCLVLAAVALGGCFSGAGYEVEYVTRPTAYVTVPPDTQPATELATEPETQPEEIPLPEYPETQPEEIPMPEYPPAPIELTDPRFRWLVEPRWQFDAVFNFSEGMAAVEYFDWDNPGGFDGEPEHILGYINRQGEIVIPIIHGHWPEFYGYRGAPPFSEGLVALQSNAYGGVGVLDTAGNIVVPFSFGSAWVFSEGLMAVMEQHRYIVDGRAWGYINTSGDLVIDHQFHYAAAFHNGRAAVLYQMRWGFIDPAGQLVVPHQFELLTGQGNDMFTPRFSEGLAAINIGEPYGFWGDLYCPHNRFGYIDLYGELMIPPVFTRAGHFENGIALVTHEDYGEGFINKAGDFTPGGHMEAQYNRYRKNFSHWRDCSEGFTAVAIGDADYSWSRNLSWGFIDEDGQVVIPLEFCEVRDFSEGIAWVRQGSWWGLVEFV